MERETGIEPATSSLGSWRSTAELLPLSTTTGSTASRSLAALGISAAGSLPLWRDHARSPPQLGSWRSTAELLPLRLQAHPSPRSARKTRRARVARKAGYPRLVGKTAGRASPILRYPRGAAGGVRRTGRGIGINGKKDSCRIYRKY